VFCDQCGFEVSSTANYCPKCGSTVSKYTRAPANTFIGTPKTPRLATASLALGLFGLPLYWLGIPSVLAIILGHIARSQIKRNPQSLRGGGLAFAGLLLGYVVLIPLLLIGLLAIFAQGSALAPFIYALF